MSETQKQDSTNLFDKIRADAEKNRTDRLKQKQETDEYFARIKSDSNPLDEINLQLRGNK
jgi:hypothetical protein